MCHEREGAKRKYSPVVELYHISVPDRVAAGMRRFRAAFPHNFFLTTGCQIVLETRKYFSKVDNS